MYCIRTPYYCAVQIVHSKQDTLSQCCFIKIASHGVALTIYVYCIRTPYNCAVRFVHSKQYTLSQCCFIKIASHGVALTIYVYCIRTPYNCAVRFVHSKQDTLNQCCFNVGPASQTVSKHQQNIGSIIRVSREVRQTQMTDNLWLSNVRIYGCKTRNYIITLFTQLMQWKLSCFHYLHG